MWRTIKAIFFAGILFAGALLGAAFLHFNQEPMVNVQFPWIARETGERPLGIALLGALGIGVGLGLLVAMFTSLGMTLYSARLKKEIRSLRKEVDALRNLPILEEEMDRTGVDESDDDPLETSRGIDVPAGPVRGGSTAAPIGGDDEDDEDSVSIDRPEDETRLSGVGTVSGTRKIETP